jgi:hypothetical protein
VTVTNDPRAELDELFSTLVTIPPHRKRKGLTRHDVRRTVEYKIQSTPLANILQQDFEVSTIIPRYDNFAFDWGTLTKGGYFVYALSFDTESEEYQLNSAKVFALTCEEVARRQKKATFIGVVQPPQEGTTPPYESAKEIFGERDIEVFATSEVDRLLNNLQSELIRR